MQRGDPEEKLDAVGAQAGVGPPAARDSDPEWRSTAAPGNDMSGGASLEADLSDHFENDRRQNDAVGRELHRFGPRSRNNDATLPRDPGAGQSPIALAVLWIVFIAADGAAQLLFKSAAGHLPDPSLTREWLVLAATTLRVWGALGCLLMVFLVWMAILRRLPLATAFPMTAATYVVVVAASQVVYGETIAPIQYLGVALIVVGVALMRPVR